MDARVSLGLQLPTWINRENIATNPSSLQCFQKCGEQQLYQLSVSCNRLAQRRRFRGPVIFKVSCSSENSPGSYYRLR